MSLSAFQRNGNNNYKSLVLTGLVLYIWRGEAGEEGVSTSQSAITVEHRVRTHFFLSFAFQVVHLCLECFGSLFHIVKRWIRRRRRRKKESSLPWSLLLLLLKPLLFIIVIIASRGARARAHNVTRILSSCFMIVDWFSSIARMSLHSAAQQLRDIVIVMIMTRKIIFLL